MLLQSESILIAMEDLGTQLLHDSLEVQRCHSAKTSCLQLTILLIITEYQSDLYCKNSPLWLLL